jgi:hypothetical protein
VKNVKVNTSQVARILPVAAHLAFGVGKWCLACGHGGGDRDLWIKEGQQLRVRAWTCSGPFLRE